VNVKSLEISMSTTLMVIQNFSHLFMSVVAVVIAGYSNFGHNGLLEEKLEPSIAVRP
jgi:hypothetical protein